MSSIRLKDVAAEAGVSLATASLALRGVSSVKKSTRAKVVEIAQKLGYRPDATAAILASRRKRTSHRTVFMAWLTAYSPDWKKRFPLGTESAVLAAAAEADRRGLSFEHCNADCKADVVSIIRKLDARGCDGIVLGRGMSAIAGQINWSRFPVISIEESLFEDGLDVVRSSLFRSTLDVLRQVKIAGYRRIGICLREHEPQHPDDEARLGAVFAFQSYDLKESERVPLKRIPFEHPDAQNEIILWVKKYQPDVVIGFSAAELWHLRQGGYAVPGEVAYVALHVKNSERGTVAGYQENLEVYPKYAVQILMEKIRHGIRGLSDHPQQTLVLPPLLEGASCPLLKTRERAAEGS